jgi:hypothetical protein
MNETGLGLKWLIATLKADSEFLTASPGGVHRGMAPPGTTTPFTIVAFQSGTDVTTMNEVRLLSDVLYQVRAVGPATMAGDIVAAADRIDALFKRTSGTVSGVRIDCFRDSPLQYDELPNGIQWSNFGGLYHLQIQPG